MTTTCLPSSGLGSLLQAHHAIERTRTVPPRSISNGSNKAITNRQVVRVLVVEDSSDDALMLLGDLRRGGYKPEFEQVETAEAFEAALRRQPWDLIVADWRLPRFSAPAALSILKQSGLDVPFIIVSGVVSEEDAVAAMKAGAQDFIRKGNRGRLIPAIERELMDAELRRNHRFLEQALQRSQKVEAVGQLASGIAHDFNNVLTIMQGYIQLVVDETPANDQTREWVDELARAANRAAALTRQLLAFSRRKTVEPTLIDLNVIAEQMEKMLRRVIGESIDLRLRLADDLGAVRADAGQMEHVILNLALNARDAMPNGGTLTIETGNVLLDESFAAGLGLPPGLYASLSVTDTGTGMSAEIQQRIFEPFFTTKEPGNGTGLGLPIVHGIIKQNRGAIRVDSRLGEGTCFRIFLPSEDGSRSDLMAGTDVHQHTFSGRGKTILLAEDDESVRNFLGRMLATRGYRVIEASDGWQALDLIRHSDEPLHLVLSDIGMPHMNGPELVEQIRALQPDARVLYMSGHVDYAGPSDCGTECLIRKPFSPAALLDRIREVLDEERTI